MAHKKRRKRTDIVSFPNLNTFFDCGVAIKVEDIINEDESVEDPFSMNKGKTTKVEIDIVEIKEEDNF